jgi:predicted metal-dependent phosphoesterase TrpH
MKLDLHVHTNHSFDCDSSIDEVVDRAVEVGLSAIAICDHDTMSAIGLAEKYSDRLFIIPGMEITTEGGTHLIGLFLNEEIVSRDIFDAIDEIHGQDGLVMIPHPFRAGSGLFYNRERGSIYNGEEMIRILSGVDLIESINYRSSPEDLIDCDKYMALHPDLPQAAGSDAHLPDEVGRAYVELESVKAAGEKDLKKALVSASRIIRYEAYSADESRESRILRIESQKKSLVVRAGGLIPSIGKSFRTFYKKSIGLIITGKRTDKHKVEL